MDLQRDSRIMCLRVRASSRLPILVIITCIPTCFQYPRYHEEEDDYQFHIVSP